MAAGLTAVPLMRQAPRAAPTTAGPSRLLVFFSPNGTIPRRWRPVASTDTLGFDFASDGILAPLEAHRKDLLVVDGLHFHNADNHEGGMAAMLTNGGGLDSPTAGASLDQVIARAVGGQSRFASLELGVQTSAWGGSRQTRMSYEKAGAWMTPDDDPRRVFERIYGVGTGDAATLRRRRMSLIDLNRNELVDLHARLGRAEQTKLERHLQALRTLEQGLTPTSTCEAPAPPRAVSAYDNAQFPDVLAQQIELAAEALGCGVTRVVTLQCAHTIAPTVMSWLGIGEQHHSLSHCDDGNVAGVEDFVATERFYAERFGALLDALRSRPDPDHPGTDRTLLDATLVVWSKELGDSRLHVCKDVPFVLAGGGLSTGRWLKVSQPTPHSRLLVAIANRFGLPLDTFGDVTAGAGALELG
jgi:hypothetical protein